MVIAALSVIPAISQQRFVSSGTTAVISLEMTVAAPASTPTPIAVTSLALPPSETVDSLAPPKETVDHRRLESSLSSYDLASRQLPDYELRTETSLGRQRFAEPQLPTPVTEVTPPRPRLEVVRTPPPPAVSVPIEPFAGLEDATPADLSRNRPPAYPRQAVRQQLEGVVLLRLEISRTGQVTEVKLQQSSGHRILDQAAIDAVKLWSGQPAQRWGRNIASTEVLPVRFRL